MGNPHHHDRVFVPINALYDLLEIHRDDVYDDDYGPTAELCIARQDPLFSRSY